MDIDAICSFRPDLYLPNRFIPFTGDLNPLSEQNVFIYGYPLYETPTGSLKMLPAFNMLHTACEAGLLNGNGIIDSTSYNMGGALAFLARKFGVKRVKLIVPKAISSWRCDTLRVLGAEPILYEENKGEPTAISLAREMGKQEDLLHLNQYENLANPAAYEKWMAPKIWELTKNKLTLFCTGLGTTGTYQGCKQFFEETDPNVVTIPVRLENGNSVPGLRDLERLNDVPLYDAIRDDPQITVTAEESRAGSRLMIKDWIPAGLSSGAALVGLCRYLLRADLDRIRNSDGNVVAVIPLPDRFNEYPEKYGYT